MDKINLDRNVSDICQCINVFNKNKVIDKRDNLVKYLLQNNLTKDTIFTELKNTKTLISLDNALSFYNNLIKNVNSSVDYVKCGDCLALIKNMPDRYVDVCFTSPPYNDIGGKNDNVDIAGTGISNTHKKYLNVETRKDWFEWQCEIIDEMLRVSKKYVLYNVQGIKNSRKDIYKIIGKYADIIHDIVIWNKPNGCPTSTPHKLSNKYEFLLILKCKGVKGVDVNSKFYTNVIVQNINSDKTYSKIHKAVMSKAFCDEVIKEFTKENDIVLDPFFGTGTTGVSCIEQNRHYIGFELCDEYYNIANERLKKIKKEKQSLI